jgi:nitroimidazol reductase NimA-like FMN-containing flavoprotein (pyridoxamine 5'-phosphate oxidase superfamily)
VILATFIPMTIPNETIEQPIIRIMTDDEAQALLVRNHVGRIAYSKDDHVDIEPIHYIYDAPWIFGRTNRGSKLFTLALNSWCAFETDDVRGLFDWESVVVKGLFSAHNGPLAEWDYDRALAAVRTLMPTALTDDDPTPHRNIVFGVRASEITGRCSKSSASASLSLIR